MNRQLIATLYDRPIPIIQALKFYVPNPLFLLVLILVANSLSAIGQTSLINNGSFESPIVSQGTLIDPTFWQTDTNNNEAIPSLIFPAGAPNYPIAQAGRQYAGVGKTGTLADPVPEVMSQTFSVPFTGTYTLTWYDSAPYVGPDNTSAPYFVTVSDTSGGQVASAGFEAFHGISPFWVQRSVNLTLSSGTYKLRFQGNCPPHGLAACIDNVSLLAPKPDLTVTSLAWNQSIGGLDFVFGNQGGALTIATTAKLFWANGATAANILSSTPIFTQDIPAGFTGQSGIFHVSGAILRNPPSGTTHLLMVADSDNLVVESNETNNTIALADVHINFGASANQLVVSDYTRSVIKDAMRFAGQAQAIITRTAGTTADQARVMFEQLEGPLLPVMTKKGCTTTLCYSYQEYDSNGDQVINVYVASKAAGESATQIKADMQQKIDDIKTANPTAFKHTADPTKLQAIDIAPNSVANENLFMQATSPTTDSRISRRLARNTVPSDLAFHLEIPQPALPQIFPAIEEVVVENLRKQPTGGGIHPLDLTPLTPSTLLLLTNRSALGLGAVSSGHQVFKFQASAGDVLSAGIDVVSYFPGSVTTNDDSVIFLFDSAGHLLELNDDTDPFESEFESLIAGYAITNSGTYYIAVATFGNNPVVEGDGTISGWEDNGGSNIQFNLLLSLIPSHLAIRSVGNSLTAMDWAESGVLQESSNILTNWLDLPLAATPHVFNATNQQRFYRIYKP